MTDEQIMKLWRDMRPTQGDPDPVAFARRIEAASTAPLLAAIKQTLADGDRCRLVAFRRS